MSRHAMQGTSLHARCVMSCSRCHVMPCKWPLHMQHGSCNLCLCYVFTCRKGNEADKCLSGKQHWTNWRIKKGRKLTFDQDSKAGNQWHQLSFGQFDPILTNPNHHWSHWIHLCGSWYASESRPNLKRDWLGDKLKHMEAKGSKFVYEFHL